jgi:hypothetical protein
VVVQPVLDALSRYRSAEPFRPFELVFRDGRRAQITWPDAVGWDAQDDQLSYAAEDDSFIHVPLSDLADVHLMEGAENRAGGTAA